MQRKFRLVLVVLAALALAIGPAGAQDAPPGPVSTPCAPGAAYDPACDVDHDGDVDVLDIQLAAGHWNQAGAWTGGDYWALGGNAGTTPGSHFLGTTDNQALEVHVGDQRALLIQRNSDSYSPNLIGGFLGNSVSAGQDGATIGGGGSPGAINSVTDDYGTVGGGVANSVTAWFGTVGGGRNNTGSGLFATVGGGEDNAASEYWATVGGGDANLASGFHATVSGGGDNTASEYWSTVGGGSTNVASGYYATVGGGHNNTASGDSSTVGGGSSNAASGGTVGGGFQNTASGGNATVGGGHNNTASGGSSTVGGGEVNTASEFYATVGGGSSNTASGWGATVPGGRQAVASHHGELAYASGGFAAAGDAQTSLYVLRRETGDETLTELFLDGVNNRLTLAADRVMTFDILVVASHRFGGGSSAGYQVAGVIRNIGGATAFVGTPLKTVLGENVAGWDVQLEASDALDALVVKVQGSSGTTIRWVASVRTVEVGR